MKYITLFIVILFLAPVTLEKADYFKMDYTKDEIISLISYKAKTYNVSESTMNHIIKNESSYTQYALKKNDGRTGCHSRGLVQLNSCYMGKDIPDILAYHPAYAVDKLAYELKKGQCGQWSTCKN